MSNDNTLGIPSLGVLTLRNFSIYLIPGLVLLLDLYQLVFLFTKNNVDILGIFVKLSNDSIYLYFFLLIVIILALGIILETIRVTWFPRFGKIFLFSKKSKIETQGKVYRKIPTVFFTDPQRYQEIFEAVSLGGCLCYNLSIPILINPFTFMFFNFFNTNNNCYYCYLFLIIIITAVINFMLFSLLFYMGQFNEEKFYKFINRGDREIFNKDNNKNSK